MKVIIAIVFLLFPVVVSAQNQGTNEADMQKLGQAMEEMMRCMAKLDRAELAAIEEKSAQFEQEVEELCSQGERGKAQEKAIIYSKELMNNPTLIQMQECGEINKKYGLPQDEDTASAMDSEFDFSKQHVCDDL